MMKPVIRLFVNLVPEQHVIKEDAGVIATAKLQDDLPLDYCRPYPVANRGSG